VYHGGFWACRLASSKWQTGREVGTQSLRATVAQAAAAARLSKGCQSVNDPVDHEGAKSAAPGEASLFVWLE
jgi:hypothetical protein